MTTPVAGADVSTPDQQGKDQGDQKLISQEQMNKLLASQKREIESKFEGFTELKAKASQFDALTESTKSEIQKANEAAAQFKSQYETAQSELDWRETLLKRQEVAASKGLDPKLWSRVKGATEDEITADVDDLLSTFGSSKSKGGGFRSGATASDPATAKENAAAAFRNVRER